MSQRENKDGANKGAALRGWHVSSPVGRWFVVVTDDATNTVVACGLKSDDDVLSRFTADEHARYRGRGRGSNKAVDAVSAYFDGRIRALNDVRVEQPGSVFLQKVWREMRGISVGEVASYSQLAAATDSPNAVRAVGSACARNRVPLIVPCHRVVRADGSLGKYYFGADIKAWLLKHEGFRLS